MSNKSILELLISPPAQQSSQGLLSSLFSLPDQQLQTAPLLQQYAQMPYQQNIVPMPPEVFRNNHQGYEEIVDQYIKDRGLKPNDVFRIDHPDDHSYSPGPNYYKYLGPGSGFRKDWHKIDDASKATS